MWKSVEVVAESGTSFGVVSDTGRILTLAVKSVGVEQWPHGESPTGGENTIEEPATRYVVATDALPPLTDFERRVLKMVGHLLIEPRGGLGWQVAVVGGECSGMVLRSHTSVEAIDNWVAESNLVDVRRR